MWWKGLLARPLTWYRTRSRPDNPHYIHSQCHSFWADGVESANESRRWQLNIVSIMPFDRIRKLWFLVIKYKGAFMYFFFRWWQIRPKNHVRAWEAEHCWGPKRNAFEVWSQLYFFSRHFFTMKVWISVLPEATVVVVLFEALHWAKPWQM